MRESDGSGEVATRMLIVNGTAWRQCRPERPWRDHYDLPAEVREMALTHGAIAPDRRQTVALLRRLRAQAHVAPEL